MAKNFDKNISQNLSSKYGQKLLHHANQVIQKTSEATGDLISNKTSDKITKVSKISPQNN